MTKKGFCNKLKDHILIFLTFGVDNSILNSKKPSNIFQKRNKLTFYTFILFAVILSGIIAVNISLKTTLETRSKAEDIPISADNPDSPDYVGTVAPFRGCNAPPAEWLCQCRLPSGKWWSECSVMESSEEKAKYTEKCGGDGGKAMLQWKYDIALAETEGKCSCGGQNVCGSLLPVRPTFPPGENPGMPPPLNPIPIITDIPTPTLTYRVPTQPSEQKIYYIPPTMPPFNPPIIEVKPTAPPLQLPKPSLNINFDFSGLNKFLQSTKTNLLKFFSQVLP